MLLLMGNISSKSRFQKVVWNYYRRYGRDMPWRRTKNPYYILVSEIMLQQTQVPRVMKFYPKFIKQFPNLQSLARAKTATVLRAWQGLGYNRRALALQKLSRTVLEKFNGRLPREREPLESLPGVGKATAGAVRVFVWNEPEVFIETNIRRVFIHFFFRRRRKVTDEELKRYVKRTLPRKNLREWYWALMDYGAMLRVKSTSGRMAGNPNRKSAHYKTQPQFAGSDRELRGKMLRLLLLYKRITAGKLSAGLGQPQGRVKKIVLALYREGFIKKQGNSISFIY